MLSQRMTKDYLLIGAGIKAENARLELDDAVALFEEQFLELQDFSPTEDITEKLNTVEDLWMNFRMRIVSTPDKNEAASIIDQSSELLKACHAVVQEIEKYANVKAAKSVNMAGRQRMLSQRIGLFYTAHYWKVPNRNIEKEFDSAKKQFEDALNTLIQTDHNTPEIMEKLNKVASQWNFSKKGFVLDQEEMMPKVIFVTTNSMLKRMNNITGLYVDVQNSLSASNNSKSGK